MGEKKNGNLEWAVRVPIFRNKIILKQMGLAIGIPFGLLIVILWAATGEVELAGWMLILTAGLFLLTYLFIHIVYGGKYDVEFIIDQKGICCRTQMKQAKKNRIINGITVVLGLLTGKFTAAGAGMLAAARQTVTVKWKSIRRVRYYPNQYSMMIKGGFAENIALFCTPENYDTVRARIQETVKI